MIVNTLAASLFVYKMTVLRAITQDIISKFNKLTTNFVWSGKSSKIALNILQANKQVGGAGLVNLKLKDISLKTTWIQILKGDQELSHLAYRALSKALKDTIWKCNLHPKHIPMLFQKESFWTDVLAAWCTYNYQRGTKDPSAQIIWANSEILINNSPIIWANPIEKGLIYIHQLYNNGTILGITEMRNYHISIMEYNSLMSAIPNYWRKWFRKNTSQTPDLYEYDKLVGKPHMAAHVYRELTSDDSIMIEKCRKWETVLSMDIPYQRFMDTFGDINKVTNVTKLRSFQYRLIQRALVTNIQLKKWKIKDSDSCSFCNQGVESIVHLFIYCPSVANLWIKIEEFMNKYSKEKIHFSVDTVFFNKFISSAGHIKNAICLITKFFIYQQKCLGNELRPKVCEQYIRTIESYERYYAIKQNRLHKHLRKWYPETAKTQQVENEIYTM